MKAQAVELFANYGQEIVFLHVLSAIIWVGGMIAIRLAVHPKMQAIEYPKIKLGRTLAIMSRFFNIVLPFIIIILLTAIILIFSMPENEVVDTKIYIWLVMSANFTWMYFKRKKAQKLFDAGQLPEAKATIALIPKLLLPINILLGLLSLWLGVGLRGL